LRCLLCLREQTSVCNTLSRNVIFKKSAANRASTAVSKSNTLNICFSHVPLPEPLCAHVDLLLAPHAVRGHPRAVVVDDRYFGEFGSSLSEYSQLLWLHDHFEVVNELSKHSNEFSRFCVGELFNQSFHFDGGMLGQYASAHVKDDMLNFARFLVETGIFDEKRVALFLTKAEMIPSSNLGIFRTITLRKILSTLKQAAAFLESGYFVPRLGYQRRTMGYLLERLTSYLILTLIEARASEPNFGHHIILSNGYTIPDTA
jgi:hypothetical protein